MMMWFALRHGRWGQVAIVTVKNHTVAGGVRRRRLEDWKDERLDQSWRISGSHPRMNRGHFNVGTGR